MKVEEYTYELPPNYTLPHEARIELDRLVEKHAMTNEEAQEFIDLHVEFIEEYAQAVKPAMIALALLSSAATAIITCIILTLIF